MFDPQNAPNRVVYRKCIHKAKGPAETLVLFFHLFTIRRYAWIACEATSKVYPFTRKLRELGYADITVAHLTELAWIVRSKKKNDKADSLKIARLHMGGILPESHLLNRKEQVKRDLFIQRVRLGVEIGNVKRQIISYLKREDVYNSLPKTEQNFSAARRLVIKALRFGYDRRPRHHDHDLQGRLLGGVVRAP